MKKYPLLLFTLLLTHARADAQHIYTLAGTGTAGYGGDGSAATSAQLSGPFGIATDKWGSVYIADRGNNRIRKATSAGIISTIAGNGAAGFSGDGGSNGRTAEWTNICSCG
jgi:hypothetical protein